jgi:DNA-binding GntR family transcriptional regulator
MVFLKQDGGAGKSGEAEAGDDRIYDSLLAAIYEVQLPPGTKLPEDALAGTFGVSRTGVRKVLQRLAVERLVDLRPNRGAVVATPTVSEARDVFAARRLVECGALPAVIANAGPHDTARLRALLRDEDAAQLRADRAAAIRLSGEFHRQLMVLSGNALLTGFLAALVVRSSLIIATYGTPIALSCRHSDHEQIMDLIEAGQVDAAVQWMERHLSDVEASCAFAGEETAEPDLKGILLAIAGRGTGLA